MTPVRHIMYRGHQKTLSCSSPIKFGWPMLCSQQVHSPDIEMLSVDPSDLFLPDLSSDTSDSKPAFSAISTAQLSSDSTPVPAAKKLRRSNTKDSSTSTTTAAASITHRPPLAIRPAPSGFSMMQQPMVGSTGGMAGGQWGYQHMPGYVWGTPMTDSPMPLDRSSSWQVGPPTNQLCMS